MTLTTLLLLTIAASVPVEMTTLDGNTITGELTALQATTATVDHDGQSQEIPVSELQELRLQRIPASRPADLELQLSDGSHFAVTRVEVSARSVAATSLLLGAMDIPRPYVSSIRLGKTDSKVKTGWEELTQRETRDDLVIVRKGDALDHIGGVVSGIDNEAVQLLLDGDPVPIPRERVFGVILAGAQPPQTAATARVELMNGDRLSATSPVLTNSGPPTGTVWGFTINLPSSLGFFVDAADVARIDFSLSKIQYLAEADPSQVVYPTDHELFLEDVWKYRRGQNSLGDPLEIGGRRYDRGLWIHSGTTLTYRLGREFRRFRAVAGIAEGIGEGCNPTIGMAIRGDGKELLNISISRGDDPTDVDLDVTTVRELEIGVLSTDPDGVCEHLGLGDARVIK